MPTTRTLNPWLVRIAAGLTLVLPPLPAPLRAEEIIDWSRDPIVPFDVDADGNAAAAAARNNRIRLFRINPGFISDPVGLADLDGLPSGADDPNAAHPTDPGPDWLELAMGADNPFFDLRRAGDPGGVGYYRVHSQVQLIDSPNTGCSVALQAVTPAGRENNGLDDGATVLSPAFSLFHALDDGTAIQGFVGKHVNLISRGTNQLDQSVQYGMAVQRPLLPAGPDGSSKFYVFVEALGRYRYDGDSSSGSGALNTWEVLPGVHWRLAENWWMSGGLVVPVTTAAPTANNWQITCSFHF